MNEIIESCNFGHITVFDQVICKGRQSFFEICRSYRCKIGKNTTANKLYHVNKLIDLQALSLGFAH